MQKTYLAVAFVGGWLAACGVNAAQETRITEVNEGLQSDEESVRLQAVDQLGKQAAGPEKEAAINALSRALKDESPAVRAHAVHALGQIGTHARPVFPQLSALADDPEPVVRRSLAQVAARIEPDSEVSVGLLVKLLGDAEPSVRVRAASALADMGSISVPALTDALKDKQTEHWAILTLNEIGPKAAEAVSALAEKVRQDDIEIRQQAILALAAIGPGAKDSVPVLSEALEQPATAPAASYALGMIGQLPSDAENVIRKNLEAEDALIRTVSAWTLSKLHPDDAESARRVVETAAEAIKDERSYVRSAAVQVLLDANPKADVLLPALDAALQDAPEEVVAETLDAVARMGEASLPRLTAALKQEKLQARAARILGRMGPAAAPAVEPLTGLLDSPDARVRREAMFALAKIGPSASSAVPPLMKVFESGDDAQRYGAGYALGRIGPAAIEAKPLLLKTEAAEDEFLSLLSTWALARIDHEGGGKPADSLEILTEGLKLSDARTRLEATIAIRRLGARAKAAEAALAEVAKNDAHPLVRDMAIDALKAVGGDLQSAEHPAAAKAERK